jgi:hypothetical protein
MKLLLLNESGEQVACLPNVEGYGVRDSRSVFAMLDLIESLIAAAKNERPAAGLLATDSAGQIAV